MAVTPLSRTRLTASQAILYGALTVGALDAMDAIVFFGLRGVRPGRIFQGIASGLLGRAALTGGPTTVALGVLLHFFIAFGIVSVYMGASRVARALAERPLLFGPPYGVVVYLVMNLVVIPLSAITRRPPTLPVIVNGVAIHLVGVGLPAALAAWAARPGRTEVA